MQVPPDLTKEKAVQWCANLAELYRGTSLIRNT